MAFRIGLSGLAAAQKDLQVTGHNIANSSTVGFKESRAEFADVFAVSYRGISQTESGSGVRVAAVTQQFRQGVIDNTGNNLDLAVSGQGFFVLQDRGEQVYSRAGAFQVDKNGFVVTAQGQRLQAFETQDQGVGERFNTGRVTDLRLETADSPPNATGDLEGVLNLNAEDATIIADPNALDPTDADTYNFSTSTTIYDSLGVGHVATFYFMKTANNEWSVSMTVDGIVQDFADPDSDLEIFPLPNNLVFNPNGLPDDPATFEFDDFPIAGFDQLTGADSPLEFDIDFTSLTQFGSPYSVNRLIQDGYSAGRLARVNIDQEGVVFAQFTNGRSLALGKVALANFENPQGLQQLGDNLWAGTFRSGEALIGEPGKGALGLIQSGALESSNVDLAEQLVNLIIAQRNYQANAQTISASDQILQTAINLR